MHLHVSKYSNISYCRLRNTEEKHQAVIWAACCNILIASGRRFLANHSFSQSSLIARLRRGSLTSAFLHGGSGAEHRLAWACSNAFCNWGRRGQGSGEESCEDKVW
ncbi:hypothetical protein HBH56_033280 [Parastagonospora nodorum]|nr:hypothetical protein HBH56_033280 [Parastagonospora nodorum]KAH3952818.1 hypothetical protein HBH53_043890 [Parastagonospora nodorum]KAH4031746.1 hypothetical protein HBI13_014990 [Parastagonospora nodorum]KAH4097795.1 hypothetical protein HBH48_024100 [Parastagonospora nodorum]KAH4126259.1 hypothetical protein HBH47_053630 [Parastagonospora nodorum]